MLSNHYPLATSTAFNWVIASLVFLIGVVIRHYFNTVHAHKGNPTWAWLAAAVLFVVIIWLSTVPRILTGEPKVSDASTHRFMTAANFTTVRETVINRCSMCHSAEPVWPGIVHAPKDVRLDSDAAIAAHARLIYLQAGASHAMPPGNITEVTPQERAQIVAWYRSAVAAPAAQ